jgi:protein ImuB
MSQTRTPSLIAKRYLSLWLPHWGTDRWLQAQQNRSTSDQHSSGDQPVVAISNEAGRRVICAANEKAMTHGFIPGLSLSDALARYPRLRHFPANPIGDGHALQRLAAWAQRFSPLIMRDHPDGLLIDITGCAHLWGDEAGLRQDMLDRLHQRGYSCRVGVADTIGAAWAAARFSDSTPILPIATHRLALAALPVNALRIDLATTEALRRLGLRRIGDLYPLPRAAIVSRFGRPLLDRLDQALGDQAEPFEAVFAPPPHRVSRIFAEPIGTADDIRLCLDLLAEKLTQKLADLGLGARRVKLSCYRLDHQVSAIGIGLSLPSTKAAHLIDLLARKIEQIAPGPGIEMIMLSAGKVEASRQSQPGLDPQGTAAETDDMASDDVAWSGLIDRLTNRLGADKIYRVIPVESHLPERASARGRPVRLRRPAAWPRIVISSPDCYWRPLRLLVYPEPIEAIAPIPDDPPLQFRWRHVLHRIRSASGPERISWEWWRAIDRLDAASPQPARDYYRVENEDGQRFWLYRSGLHQPDQPARWFLHGFFA